VTQTLKGTRWAGLFSSASGEWETPQDLFDALDAEFLFEVDVCARAENAKRATFFSPDDDGLSQPWRGVCWMNPPYGRSIGRWMEKAYRETRSPHCRVVALVHARTDTAWWHEWAMKAAELRFIRGRLRFRHATGNQASCPFPSLILVFHHDSEGPPIVRTWSLEGET